MRKMLKPPTPKWLKEKEDQWGEDFKQKKEEWGKAPKGKKLPTFHWRRNKNRGYEEILKKLSTLTKHHCSFCDAFPMGSRIRSTVEHFRPKSEFPLEAYRWDNLFLCCDICQSEKLEKYDPILLKPDDKTYRFDLYFSIEPETGKLIPNPYKEFKIQSRAKKTIELYGFNNNGKPEDRLMELNKFERDSEPIIDEYPYRFFIEFWEA